ncbi:MAG: proteasome subunit alpha [Actinobacteria bacterium]|nr:proteasome subunit alpha [Actinomycetota bacterium]
MSLPYYISPEQFMKDKHKYAREGISRGKSVLAMEFSDGVLFVAENPSATLHKVSEIYDKVAFAGVGKFNEFETLRMHGIRQADVRGYSYSREDVTARGLANSYSQVLGLIFTEQLKPYEVEILVAAVGDDPETNELYHILYDGSVADEHGYVAMGGEAEALGEVLQKNYKDGMTMAAALKVGSKALSEVGGEAVPADNLEVAVLDRKRERRKFRRVSEKEIAELSR